MDIDRFNLESKCDGLRLFVTMYIPKGKIKGIVQFAHGMVEHQVYYYDFMEYLCKKGYLCVINDHRGHGNSTRKMADLGYFYEENGDYIVEDLHQITEYVKDRYKDLDVYLFGHSMGSLVVRKYIKKYDKDIKKLIVCGSPSMNKITGFGLFLCKTIKLFRGDKYRSRFINSLDVDGIKIHMLAILKHTKLEQIYIKNKFHILTKDEYIDIVIRQLEILNPKIVIHRITEDPKIDDLIEPKWLINKRQLLNDIDKEMNKRKTYQGIYFR